MGMIPIAWRVALCSVLFFSPGTKAQTVDDLVALDSNRSYYDIKHLMSLSETKIYTDGGTSGLLRLSSCTSSYVLFGQSNDSLMRELVRLSFQVIHARIVMQKSRLSDSIWRPALIKWEDAILNLVKIHIQKIKSGTAIAEFSNEKWRMADIAAKAINANIRASGVPNLTVTFEAECGGPAAFYRIRTNPNGGEVFFIPKLLYNFCQKKNIDPRDINRCKYWYPPAASGTMVELGGVHMYFVRWQATVTEISQIDTDRWRTGSELLFDIHAVR